MAVYLWGAGVVVAAGLGWGVVLWRAGMPLMRPHGDYSSIRNVESFLGFVIVMAMVWPILVPLALRALWRWLWKNAAAPGGDDPG